MENLSNAFECFMKEAPAQAKAWMGTVTALDTESALDKKTEETAYIAVLAAQGLLSGLPFHVKHAKSLGVTREEVISAILVGLPAVGNEVVAALPV
ncbi:MAG: carboxymuconolactone decarboxylase family protein, partial [Clostridia bacterium]|nr:carboxymuconolactone decarboxylase family protein [Clostridia bacterium]